MPVMKVAIGIDLGMTKCCVGVVCNGQVKIVENERGNKTTPSYVAFTDTERLIGEDAKDQAAVNPTNTVFGVKGLVGRNSDQVTTYCKEHRLPFEIVELSGKPRIKVTYKGEERLFSPEQILAMLLSKMKRLAESHVGCAITDAVISVPAYFNNSQRLATKAAAEIAGLKVLRLINEPTAAAVGFASNRRSKEKESVMMIDIGGGSFEASFINMSENEIKVQSTQGDCHFGGQTLDVYLLNYFVDEFHKKHGIDLLAYKKAVERLRHACEGVKQTLSLLSNASVQLECLANDVDFEFTISRATFESVCDETIPQSLMPVLISAGLTVDRDIDHVVVVGGSSRVPMFCTAVRDFFNKDITKTINLNESVAFGATVQAGLLQGENSNMKINVSDISPHSIDLVPTTSMPVTIVNKDASIPFQNRLQGTSTGEATFMEFVYHSNDSKKEYNLLGNFHENCKESEEGEQMEIKYGIDGDGIFFASALHHPPKAPNTTPTHVDACIQILDKVQLQEMSNETEAIDEEDKKHQESLVVLSELETCCFALRKKIEKVVNISCEGKEVMVQSCNEVLEWLDSNPNASVESMLKKKSELEELFRIIREQLARETPSTV